MRYGKPSRRRISKHHGTNGDPDVPHASRKSSREFINFQMEIVCRRHGARFA